MSAIDVDPMVQAMFGRFAVQVAFNYVVQHGVDGEADRAILLGTTSFANKMSFGGGCHRDSTRLSCAMESFGQGWSSLPIICAGAGRPGFCSRD